MAAARKYAALPDLDQAPDVYETPDLADDVSTIPTTSARSPDGSEDGRSLDDEDDSGVVRRGINKNQADTKFQDTKVDARQADFSDRLNGSRQYYRTSSRRRRRESTYSDEEEEFLDHKLARLKKEIEEARIELAEKNEDRELFSDAPETKADGEEDDDILENINNLSEALDAVYSAQNGSSGGLQADLAKTISKFDHATAESQRAPKANNSYQPTSTSSPEYQAQLSQALAKAAEFDTRLSFLEHALGLSGATMPEQDSTNPPKPIMHTLQVLDRQVQTLTNSSASVDAASGKTRKLIEQAENLAKRRAEYDATDHPTPDDAESLSKVNALYGTLSTIDSLAPTLPMVLDRLRTLRLLHTSAASAGSTLDDMEKRQGEQAGEIRQWSEALNQVERNLRASEAGLSENVKNVEDWVKELEDRMTKLA